MARYPGFVGPAYTLGNRIAADDELINLFPSKVESGTGAAEWELQPAPGYVTRYTLPTTPTRGSFTLNGATFAVGGDSLYEIPISGSPILRATGLSNINNELVSFTGNGDSGFQFMLTSDSKLYCFEVLTNTLTLIPDISASSVVFQDGYFIALDPSTSTGYLSALENGLVWDREDAFQRNDSPDKWLSMITRPKEVWLFGLETTSVYYNAGDADTPFIPNPSVAIPYGSPAPFSVGLLAGSPIWLSNDLTVRYANGYTAQRVSTHAVEYSITQMSTIADADAFCYEDQGHQFYVLSFPTAGVTWVFDRITGMWHKRGQWNGLTYDAVPVWWHTFGHGMHLVGDRVTGAIYEQTQDSALDTDGVSGLRWLRRAPHLLKEKKLTGYDRFELHMETGLGLSSGQGSDPLVMLRWSNDGGQTFGQTVEMSVGRIGQFKVRPYKLNCGSARDRVFEVSGSDPIPYRLVDAYVDLRVGAS